MLKQKVWIELSLNFWLTFLKHIFGKKKFSLKLKIGSVPKCCKTKTVSTLYKEDLRTDPNNFRPISTFPISMEPFEDIVHDQISEFIKENKFLSDRQPGFKKLISTCTSVLDVSVYILKQLDNKKYVSAMLIDLKKVFATVNHKILLKIIWCCVFQNQVFDWFECHLSECQ